MADLLFAAWSDAADRTGFLPRICGGFHSGNGRQIPPHRGVAMFGVFTQPGEHLEKFQQVNDQRFAAQYGGA